MSTSISVNVAGQLLNDRYKVIRALGAGGMGQTFVAEDTQRPGNPQCVVKLLKPANADPNFLTNARRLFNSEAEILEKLGNHDQIPRLLAYFEQDQEFYLVQEFIDGQPLSAELPLGQRWSETQVIQLLQEVLLILEFVHRHSAIHRDIKPDNIVRRQSDRKLVLIDFGAVKQVQIQRTVLGQVSLTIGIGTPGYMPTEQSKGTPRPSSDLYALGMVCIQALTGLLPTQLRENDEGEIIWRDQAEVSDELAIILTKMVRYHFKDRYKTVTETLQAIHLLNPGISPSVPPSADNPQRSPIPPYSPTVDSSSESSELFDPFKSAFSSAFQNEQTNPPQKPINLPRTEVAKDATTPWWKSGWAIAGLSALFVSVVGGAYFTHKQLQRQEQQTLLSQLEQFQKESKYEVCIDQAKGFPQDNSDLYIQAKNVMEKCQLIQAQQLFNQAEQLSSENHYLDAIKLANRITLDVPIIYQQAQPKIEVWANNILESATGEYRKGHLETAVSWAKAIPENSSVYQKTSDAIEAWEKEWKSNEDFLEKARQLLEQRNWQKAKDTASEVMLLKKPVAQNNEYWKKNVNPIISRANAEIDREVAVAAAVEAERRSQELERTRPLVWEGNLSRNEDNVLVLPSNGQLYQDYSFEGTEGQVVTITMESAEFDTRLNLLDPNRNVIETNDDDVDSDLDASIQSFTLPRTGTYYIRAMTYDSTGRGEFVLTLYRDAS